MVRCLFTLAAFCCVIFCSCTVEPDKATVQSPEKEAHSAIAPLKICGDNFIQVNISGPNDYSRCLLSPLDTLVVSEPDTGLYIIKVTGRAGIGIRIDGTDQQYFPISAESVPPDYNRPPYRFHFESVTPSVKKGI